jgi:predicted ATPase
VTNLFIKSAHIQWDEIEGRTYLKEIPAISKIDTLEFKKQVTFFVGENGTGKSTMLEAIADAYGFNPEGGTVNFRFNTYEDLSELGSHVRLSRGVRAPFGYFFRAETFFNLATQAEKYELKFNGRNLHEQSHGESFWAFFNKYNGAGLYIMDEPEAALSPQRQLSLLIHIKEMEEVGSQFIIISHSPILLGYPDADIISFDDGEVHRISYEETESYQVTEMFINNRKQLLHQLFDE